MEMNLTQASEVVAQVQLAHRISVGFFRRFLPMLDAIGTELDLEYWYWEPTVTSMPRKGARPPSTVWAWDYFPLYASTHGYRRIAGGGAVAGDVSVLFDVSLNENFDKEKLRALGIKGQPDAVDLPQGAATFVATAYLAEVSDERSYEHFWNESDSPEIDGSFGNLGENISGISFTWPLAEVISNREIVHDALAQYVKRPV